MRVLYNRGFSYEILLETGRGVIDEGDFVTVDVNNGKVRPCKKRDFILGMAIEPSYHRNSLIHIISQGFVELPNSITPGAKFGLAGIAVDSNTICINCL